MCGRALVGGVCRMAVFLHLQEWACTLPCSFPVTRLRALSLSLSPINVFADCQLESVLGRRRRSWRHSTTSHLPFNKATFILPTICSHCPTRVLPSRSVTSEYSLFISSPVSLYWESPVSFVCHSFARVQCTVHTTFLFSRPSAQSLPSRCFITLGIIVYSF